MPDITFIYRIGNNKTVYYGKFISNNVEKNHSGLDKVIYPILKHYINVYRLQKNQPELKQKIHIGILACGEDEYNIYNYCSLREKNCFDFYLFENRANHIAYVNGKLL